MILPALEEITNLPTAIALIGTVLFLFEAVAPGAHFAVLGSALLLSGMTGIIFGIETFLPLAALVGIYGVVSFAVYKNLDIYSKSNGEMTLSSTGLQGERGKVTETVTSDSGEIKLEQGFNPYYKARSSTDEEIEVGAHVKVVNPRGGNVLVVEEIESEEPEDSP